MKDVGIYEAKTRLARLVKDIERGEVVTLTRHGRPVAKIVPMDSARPGVDEATSAIEGIRRRAKPGPPSVLAMIEAGRRRLPLGLSNENEEAPGIRE